MYKHEADPHLSFSSAFPLFASVRRRRREKIDALLKMVCFFRQRQKRYKEGEAAKEEAMKGP